MQCDGCVKPDCGKCGNCKDKKKFGGPGKRKKGCMEKSAPWGAIKKRSLMQRLYFCQSMGGRYIVLQVMETVCSVVYHFYFLESKIGISMFELL